MIRRVALMANLGKPEAIELLRRLLVDLRSRPDLEVVIPPEEAARIGRLHPGVPLSAWQGVELVVVLGGDGTLLNAARRVAPLGIPLLGVNMGRLGFLTEVDLPHLQEDLDAFLRGEGQIEERMMLTVRLPDGQEFLALNDVVIARGGQGRLVDLDICVDDVEAGRLLADGVIVATPTGSTAYSLSAGGPVVAPDIAAILITPVAAHTFHSRPLVVGPQHRLVIGVASEATVAVDGQTVGHLHPSERVIAERALFRTRLLRRRQFNFYHVLREKFGDAPGGGPLT